MNINQASGEKSVYIRKDLKNHKGKRQADVITKKFTSSVHKKHSQTRKEDNKQGNTFVANIIKRNDVFIYLN